MKQDKLDIIGKFSGLQALVEIGLGSVLHAIKVPFGGHFLSIHQACLLSVLSRNFEKPARYCYLTANIVACLKSFSPAGNKLGPMLSISMQGGLYSLGIGIFGGNIFGVFMGAALLSLWAFIQPLLTLYLFFGSSFSQSLVFYSEKMHSKLGFSIQKQWSIFIVILLTKLSLTTASSLYFYFKKESYFKITEKLKHKGKTPHFLFESNSVKSSHLEIAIAALKDLLSPFFLLSLVFTGLFLYFSKHEFSQLIWLMLRPVAMAFCFFFIARHPFFFSKLLNLSARYPQSLFFKSLGRTLHSLRGIS